jgi:beta-galactosidase
MNGISRRQFNALAAAGAAVAVFGGSGEVEAGKSTVTFPFGVHIYREPSLPMEQLLADIPILKRLGFNMIKLQEVWAYDERREGEINLDKVERLIADAQQHGMKVYFGFTMENAPAWLWRKFPDATMLYEDGSPHLDPTQYVLAADGKPGPCWYHPGVRAAAETFIGELVRRLGRYENIAFWNVWQEIGLWPNRPGHVVGLDYSSYTLVEFRKWLQTKYKSLDDLNAAWRTPYGDWRDVTPPRFTPNVPAIVDSRYFMDDVYLSDALKFKRAAVLRADPKSRPVFAHLAPPRAIGGTQEWSWAKELDFLGTSCYPAWGEPAPWDYEHDLPGSEAVFAARYFQLWNRVLLSIDYVRSARADGHVWAAELQGGPISQMFTLGRAPEPADIRRWTLGVLAAGVKGISFWNHRPEILLGELEGFGLLDSAGETTPRAAEAGRIGQAINAHADLFLNGDRVRPDVAIIVNEDLFHLFESIGDMHKHYEYTIRGIYRSLWDQGFGIDFLNVDDLVERGGRYKMIVLPMPFALSPATMSALQGYVRDGGTLVSECGPGRMDRYGVGYNEDGMAVPMRNLFGVESVSIRNVREPNETTKWRSELRFDDTIGYQPLTGRGDGIAPANYLQTLRPVSAKSIFNFGNEVAGTVNTYGKGRAYLIGTLLGHATLAYNDLRNAKFLAAAASDAGAKPDRVGKLLRLRRRLGNTEAWFLMNIGKETITETVPLSGYKRVVDLFGDRIDVRDGVGSVQVRSIDIACWILS